MGKIGDLIRSHDKVGGADNAFGRAVRGMKLAMSHYSLRLMHNRGVVGAAHGPRRGRGAARISTPTG